MSFHSKFKQLITKEWFALLTLVTLFLVRQIPTISFDLIIGDEGIIVMAYKRVFQGYTLYQDIWHHYGPIGPYFYSLIFNIFGVSLLVVRYASTFLLTICIVVSFLISRRFLSLWWSVMAALLSFLMIFQPIYSYSNIFTLFGGVFGIFFLLKFREKLTYKWVFFSGVAIGLSILQKPIPIGISMWLSLCLSLIIYRYLNKELYTWSLKITISLFLLGTCIIIIPVYSEIIYSNTLEILQKNFLFFLTYFGSNAASFSWPNFFSYFIAIFNSQSFLSLFFALKDTYYSLCFYLPLLMGILTFFYVLRHRDKPCAFALLTLAVFSPMTFMQFYYSGNRIGHGEMGLIIPTTILLAFYFVNKLFYLESAKKSKIIIRSVLIIGLLSFYIIPSLYIFKPEIREQTLTIPALNGIKVSQTIYEALEKTHDFLRHNLNHTDKIVTAGFDTDIFNLILDNPNAFGSDYIYWRELYNSGDKAEEIFHNHLMPTLIKESPRVIVIGLFELPGEDLNKYLKDNYYLAFKTGHSFEYGKKISDYHYYAGYKVYLNLKNQ